MRTEEMLMNRKDSYFRNRLIHPAFMMLVVASLLAVPAFPADFSINTFLDRNPVPAGENFTLSVELSGPDADEASSPQPPDLEAFATYLGSGSSTSVQIVNGSMSQTRTLNFYFRAKTIGTFEIGPVTALLAGVEYRSNPIQIEVVQSQGQAPSRQQQRPSQSAELTRDDLFIRATADKKQAYVNESVIVTYKIYTRVDVSQYGVSSLPDYSGFWVEDLSGDPARAQTTSEMFNGLRYTVATIKRVALFPTAAGKRTIEPMQVECAVRLKPSSRSLFDDFFSDPFGRTVRYRLESDPLQIDVLPLPEEGRPADFSGAVGLFTLEGKVDKAALPVNDVASLKVTLRGSGNIRTLPKLSINASPGLETYDPEVSETVQPTNDGVAGTRTYEWVVVPRATGKQTIETLRLAYFDPHDREYKVTTLEEIVFDVKPGSGLDISGTESAGAKEQIRMIAEDIRFIKLSPGDFRPVNSTIFRSIAFWSILLLPLAGIAVAYLYSRHRGRLEIDTAYARSRRAGKAARRHLASARTLLTAYDDEKDFYAECERALSGFAADKLNVARAGIVTEDLRHLLNTKGVPEAVVEEYLDCLRVCDLKRFSPAPANPEENSAFLKRAEMAVQQLEEAISR